MRSIQTLLAAVGFALASVFSHSAVAQSPAKPATTQQQFVGQPPNFIPPSVKAAEAKAAKDVQPPAATTKAAATTKSPVATSAATTPKAVATPKPVATPKTATTAAPVNNASIAATSARPTSLVAP